MGVISSIPHAFSLYFQKVLFKTSTTACAFAVSPPLLPLALKSNCIRVGFFGIGDFGGLFDDWVV